MRRGPLLPLVCGVILACVAARLDDVIVVCGGSPFSPMELSAGPESLVTRVRGVSSTAVTLSNWSDSPLPDPRDVLTNAPRGGWSTDPLVGFVALGQERSPSNLRVFRQGWPLDAFIASSRNLGPVEGGFGFTFHGREHVVSLSPLWFGFLTNTLIFAGAVWMTIEAPRLAVRATRRRAGRCSRCAYPRLGIGPGQPCPECGLAANS